MARGIETVMRISALSLPDRVLSASRFKIRQIKFSRHVSDVVACFPRQSQPANSKQ
jgi:hypothetical protein